jgi:hypothetical protein
MRKTLVYVVILAVLGAGIYFLLFRSSNEMPYSKEEADFTVRDTASIGKLFLAAPDGESVLLERTDSGWIVNKQYKALRSTLDVLLGTMAKQAALYPVPKTAYDNVIKGLSTEGIKVEVYGRDGKKKKVFYVGGSSVNNTGTNMMMEGAKQPYIVQVPGFVGYLTPRYAVQMQYWRDRMVFDIPQEEIKSISIKYIDRPLNSFEVIKQGTDVTVTADPSLVKGLQGVNKRRANVYTRYFTNVFCEGYLNGLPDMDTTLKTAPKQSEIDVQGIHGQHQHADIYWMAINRRSKNLETSNPDVPDDYDADRLYAVINNGKDTVMIQQFAFRNIFHKAYEFFQSDSTVQSPLPAPKRTGVKNINL